MSEPIHLTPEMRRCVARECGREAAKRLVGEYPKEFLRLLEIEFQKVGLRPRLEDKGVGFAGAEMVSPDE